MINRTELVAYAEEVGRWLDIYVEPVLDFLKKNKVAVKIEEALPHGDKVIKALGGLASAESFIAGLLPEVGQIYAMYEVYKALGGQPATVEYFDQRRAELLAGSPSGDSQE